MDIWASQRGWHREAQTTTKLPASIAFSHSCSFISTLTLIPSLSLFCFLCCLPQHVSGPWINLHIYLNAQADHLYAFPFYFYRLTEDFFEVDLDKENESKHFFDHESFSFELWSAMLFAEFHSTSWRLCKLKCLGFFFLYRRWGILSTGNALVCCSCG